MEKRADFEIFFLDFHRVESEIHIRAVVSNIGETAASETVCCYVRNRQIDGLQTLAASSETPILKSGESCTASLKFAYKDIAYKAESYSVLKSGEYLVTLGTDAETAVEVFAFTVDNDIFVE